MVSLPFSSSFFKCLREQHEWYWDVGQWSNWSVSSSIWPWHPEFSSPFGYPPRRWPRPESGSSDQRGWLGQWTWAGADRGGWYPPTLGKSCTYWVGGGYWSCESSHHRWSVYPDIWWRHDRFSWTGHGDTSFLERTYRHPQMAPKQNAAQQMTEVIFPGSIAV